VVQDPKSKTTFAWGENPMIPSTILPPFVYPCNAFSTGRL